MLAGVEFLKGRKDVRGDRIGLIGHSEGGIIAPLAASRSKDVAFVVMLAGTGLPGDEVMALQHLGAPYFKASWGTNVVGLVLDAATDWQEVAELLTDSYCVQAPAHLAAAVDRPAARLQP